MALCGVVALVCARPPALAAQPADLSLEAAVRMALESHPALQAGDARTAAALDFLTQSGLRPNPRVILQTENWRAWGAPGLHVRDQVDTYAYVAQPIELGGKRARRTELARAAATRADLERELTGRRISAGVKQAYWTAAAAERIHRVWLDNVANFRQIVEYHEVRVREGAMAEADLLKVRVEAERLALSANSASLDASQSRIELLRVMGGPDLAVFRIADRIEDLPSVPAADLQLALENRTEMKIARAAVVEAEANLKLQRAMSAPAMDAMWGYKRTAGFNTVVGGAQFDLPVWNRNQGNIGAAESQVRAAKAELAAAAAQIRAEVRAASEQAIARGAQVSGALRQLMAQAGDSSKIALAAYREGGADLLRIVDAERVRIELEALYFRTLGDYRQSLVALETAMGASR